MTWAADIKIKLTRNQVLQLLALFDAGALTRASSKRADQLAMGHPLVIGKLRDLTLADSMTVRRLGRQWTQYWLTDAGRTEARALAQARAA